MCVDHLPQPVRHMNTGEIVFLAKVRCLDRFIHQPEHFAVRATKMTLSVTFGALIELGNDK